MPHKPPPSRQAFAPLLEAAQAFADELQSYALLSESFQRAPLVSAKHLERINDTLTQIGASEQRLSECGQALAQAVSAARERQEQLARATLDRIPAIKERTGVLADLVGRFDRLGREVTTLNQAASALARPGEVKAGDEADRRRSLASEIKSLSEQAQALTAAAHAAEFEELAQRAHALHQQLFSAHKKLELAQIG
jgi:ATP-dependent exoDNAse (exonuclease V) beta subunit